MAEFDLEGIDLSLPQVQINELIIEKTGENVVELARLLTLAGMLGPRFRSPTWEVLAEHERQIIVAEAQILSEGDANLVASQVAANPLFDLDKVLMEGYEADLILELGQSWPYENGLDSKNKKYLVNENMKTLKGQDFDFFKNSISSAITQARQSIRGGRYFDHTKNLFIYTLVDARVHRGGDYFASGCEAAGIMACLGSIEIRRGYQDLRNMYLQFCEESRSTGKKRDLETEPLQTKIPGMFAIYYWEELGYGYHKVKLGIDQETHRKIEESPLYLPPLNDRRYQ